MKAHDDLTFNVIGETMAYYDLTFNVIGATMESPSKNPLACLYKPRVCGNKVELLRRNPCRVWLFFARPGAGLVDSRLTSPRDPSALLREVPLPLFLRSAPCRHELEQTLGDGEGQGSLTCCSSWGCRVRHDSASDQASANYESWSESSPSVFV